MPVVPAQLARECMDQYELLMKSNDLNGIHGAFTGSVTFQTREFSAWISAYLATSDAIRLSFGVYTGSASAQLGIPEQEGRVTAFVWPVKGTLEYDPYNMGEIEP